MSLHPPDADTSIPARMQGPSEFAPGTLSRDAFSSLIHSGAIRGATLGLSIAAARLAGPSGAGAFGVAVQVVALASAFATFSIPTALAQHLARSSSEADRRRLLAASAQMIACLAIPVSLALMLLSPVLASNLYSDRALAPVLVVCGPLTLAAAAYQWLEGALQGLRRFGSLARGGTALAALELAVGVLSSSWGVVGMLVSRALVRSVGTVAIGLKWLRVVPSPAPVPGEGAQSQPELSRGEIVGSLARFAAPTLIGGTVGLAGHAVLRMLLVRFSELGVAGHFHVADSVAQGVTLIPLAASAALMPAAASMTNRPGGEAEATFRRAIRQVTAYNLALCLLAVGLAPWLIEAVFGVNFVSATRPFVLLVLAYGAMGPTALLIAWLLARGRPWTILWVNLLWAGILAATFVAWFSREGAVGAASASVVAHWAALATYALVLAPRHSLRLSIHLPWISLTAALLGTGVLLQVWSVVPSVISIGWNVMLAALVFAWLGLPSLRPRNSRQAP